MKEFLRELIKYLLLIIVTFSGPIAGKICRIFKVNDQVGKKKHDKFPQGKTEGKYQ